MDVAIPLRWADYLILVAFLVASLGIGLYHALTGGRQKTTAEFIMANRNMRVLPTSVSLLVSYQSAIMVLGLAAEMYWYGIQLLILYCLSFTFVTVIIVVVFIPWMVPLKLVSIYEYLDLRFDSKAVRIFGATLGVVSGILYMGVAMYAPSAALESATGLPLMVSIPLMAVVTIAYTALGGMRAVIWTDVFQFLTMVGGMLAILVKGLVVVGGFGKVFELCGQEGRLSFVDWDPDPRIRHTFWGFMIGVTVSWLQVYGISQSSVQRFGATKNLATARQTMIWNLPGLYFMEFLANATGLVLLAYYASISCDPMESGQIKNYNQLLPNFVMRMFANAPGFGGLFLAVLYGGALSSVSSSLSGAAANCWEDMLKWKLSHMQESRKALVNRLLVVVFGVVATAIAFLSATVPGPITQVSSLFYGSVTGPLLGLYLLGGLTRRSTWQVCMVLCGSVSGPLLGLFMLGGITRRNNWKGAIIGGCTGMFVTMWLSAGSIINQIKYPSFPPVSVEGCYYGNDTSSLLSSGLIDYENETTTMFHMHKSKIYLPHNREFTDSLEGMNQFYAISYIWYPFIGTVLTLIIGSIASLPFRDRKFEEKLDEKFLLNLRKYIREFTLRSESTDERPLVKEPFLPECEVILQQEDDLRKPDL